ncbi:hypothetical protein IWZ01DRAFT_543516 [Phyllosticta capitalensis]
MSSRSSSASSSTFISTSRSSSSSYSYTTTSSPPPRYTTHFTHLPPNTHIIDQKHSQEVEPAPKQYQQHLSPHHQPRWTPLSSHGLPRAPLTGQASQLEHTRTRARSVSISSPIMGIEGPPRSQSRPGTTTCGGGHRQTQSLGTNCYDHHGCHTGRSCAQDAQNHNNATGSNGEEEQRERSDQTASTAGSSKSKLKQLRSKVAGWRERERERRREAREDVVEVGGGGHWSEY